MELSLTPILGGALIGLSATILLMFHGKVAGISGIFNGVMTGEALSWRGPFLIGLLASGVMMLTMGELFGFSADFNPFVNTVPRSMGVTAFAGLLVGFGTKLGNGCTSGHGICGLGRASKRSLTATMSFMVTGAIAAYVTQHVIFQLVTKG